MVEMGLEHAGRRGAAKGADFENLVIATNQGYQKRGLGIVKKNQVRKMVAAGRLIHAEKSTVDFDGFMVGIGFVAFDCKSVHGGVWRPDKDQIHQHLFLLTGQRLMPKTHARFFYLIQMRIVDDTHGSLMSVNRTYLVENLEELTEAGKYEANPADEVHASAGGFLVDYRKKLLEIG
jgi:penicillin-binding protein-related factor A (putative recombinase)